MSTRKSIELNSPDTRNNSTLDAALRLSAQGIPVFPCHRDKSPTTRNGFYDATTDERRIRAMFYSRDLLIGMPTGAASGIDVIDEDPRNGGDLDTLGPLPMEVVARSKRGGRHVFVKHRPGNRCGDIAEGIDLKADGGYVVLWGESDEGQWINGDLTTQLPDFPEHVQPQRKGATLRATGVDTSAIRNGVSEGKRNDLIFRGLCQYRHFNRPLDDAKKWAADAAMNSDPPYDEVDTDEMAERVYAEYEPGDFPDPDGEEYRLVKSQAANEFPMTDIGNAERLVHRHGDKIRYVPEWGKFVVWNGKRWVEDTGEHIRVKALAKDTVRAIYTEASTHDDANTRKKLADWAKSSESASKINSMVSVVKSEPGILIGQSDLDKDPWLLNCNNGTLDLRTGALREYRPEDLITKLAPVDFDPNAMAHTFEAFLQEILPSEPVRKFVQRLIGYSLNGTTEEHKLPILYGHGANGKGTLLNTILDMLGDYAMQAANELLMARHNSHPTDQADLFGKRFVTNQETAEGQRFNESLVKQMTGGDRIRARRMREDFWEFEATHTLFLATNHKPVIRGTDHAIWRRLRLVPFTVTIPEENQDKRLPAKLRAELPGILAWAVRGHVEWLEHGLGEPNEVRAATNEYRSEMDVLGEFIEDRCKVDPDAKVVVGDLYEAYEVWCAKNGEDPLPTNLFGRKLTERGIAPMKSNGVRYRVGIDLKRSGLRVGGSDRVGDSGIPDKVSPIEPVISKVPTLTDPVTLDSDTLPPNRRQNLARELAADGMYTPEEILDVAARLGEHFNDEALRKLAYDPARLAAKVKGAKPDGELAWRANKLLKAAA